MIRARSRTFWFVGGSLLGAAAVSAINTRPTPADVCSESLEQERVIVATLDNQKAQIENLHRIALELHPITSEDKDKHRCLEESRVRQQSCAPEAEYTNTLQKLDQCQRDLAVEKCPIGLHGICVHYDSE